MRRNDIARNAQPQPHALHNPTPMNAAIKWLEDFFLLLRWNTRATIRHLHAELFPRQLPCDGNLPSSRGEFDGIAKQIP